MIGKMAHSHSYTFDCLCPSSSLTESGVGPGGADVNWIQVQPHRVSKDKKPILDYDSNDDFEGAEFDDSGTLTGKAAILQFQEFDDLSASPQDGLMEDFTIVTQENSGRFPQAPEESRGGFPQATQENSGQFPQVTQENSGRFPQATQENSCCFPQVTPINSGQISRETCGRNGMWPTSTMIATAKPIFF
jgi:hypothetical protein